MTTPQAIGVTDGVAPVLLQQNGQALVTVLIPVTPGSGVEIENQGTPLGMATTINFVGSGVTAALGGATATVDIPGGGGGSTTAVVVTGQTTSGVTTGSGTPVYESGNNTVLPASAAGFPFARVVGVYEGTSGQYTSTGTIPDAQFDSAAASVAGQPCWLSATATGKFTAVAPTTSGQVVSPLGTILVGAGAGVATSVLLNIGTPIQL